MSDYYAILGIDQNAPPDEVKQAYHRLARRYHPDVNPAEADDTRASQQMAQVNQAYNVLIDPQARAAYDQKMQVFPASFADRAQPSSPDRSSPSGPPESKSPQKTKDGDARVRRVLQLAQALVLCAAVALLVLSALSQARLGQTVWVHQFLHWLRLDSLAGRGAWAILLIVFLAMILIARRLTEL